MLQSEDDEYLDELFPHAEPAQLAGVRDLLNQLNNSRPNSRQSRGPLRLDSKAVSSVPFHYSVDSDADDEGADDFFRRVRDQLSLEGDHSRSTSSNSSRAVSLGPPTTTEEEDDDSDSSQSLKGSKWTLQTGQRTPPSRKATLIDADYGRYAALLTTLETPRAVPELDTPSTVGGDEDEPLPSAFARLRDISPVRGAIGKKRSKLDLGPPARLDLEGWRNAKDNNPDVWCCEFSTAKLC